MRSADYVTLETAERIKGDPNYQPPGEPIEAAPPAQFKPVKEFCDEYTPLSYAVEPFIRSSSLDTLTAKTGGAKTALLIGMALAIATGRSDILGREVTRGRVAYLAAENPMIFECGSWSQPSCSISTLGTWRTTLSSSTGA
jgi:AAA domain